MACFPHHWELLHCLGHRGWDTSFNRLLGTLGSPGSLGKLESLPAVCYKVHSCHMGCLEPKERASRLGHLDHVGTLGSLLGMLIRPAWRVPHVTRLPQKASEGWRGLGFRAEAHAPSLGWGGILAIAAIACRQQQEQAATQTSLVALSVQGRSNQRHFRSATDVFWSNAYPGSKASTTGLMIAVPELKQDSCLRAVPYTSLD